MMKLARLAAGAILLVPGACSSGGASDQAAASAPVALVKLAPATRGRIAKTVQLYGEVLRGGADQAVLAAPVEAVVQAVLVPQGASVRRGQVIARLSPSPGTTAQMTSASAQAQSAAQALARAQRLRADGLASDADVESARAAAKAASAQAAALTRQRSGLVLKAPDNGYVVSIAASPGELVQPGTTVATIATGRAQVASFGVDPALGARLGPGMTASISRASGNQSVSASIASVSPVADPQTRLATVLVRLPAGSGFFAGQALVANVTLPAQGDALTIPYAALLDDGGQPFVYVVSKGVAHRHDVQVGSTNGDAVAILSGLSAGDQVVTAGGTGVEDGMKVRTR